GINIDQELRFKLHTDYIVRKAMKWLTQTKRIMKAANGIQGEYARQLCNRACVLQMLYGVSVWLTPIV
ncbi:hypothetical protein FIBSPDRAFT_743175, partial [Athelia psychrophila]